jgi:hypothetical protein
MVIYPVANAGDEHAFGESRQRFEYPQESKLITSQQSCL